MRTYQQGPYLSTWAGGSLQARGHLSSLLSGCIATPRPPRRPCIASLVRPHLFHCACSASSSLCVLVFYNGPRACHARACSGSPGGTSASPPWCSRLSGFGIFAAPSRCVLSFHPLAPRVVHSAPRRWCSRLLGLSGYCRISLCALCVCCLFPSHRPRTSSKSGSGNCALPACSGTGSYGVYGVTDTASALVSLVSHLVHVNVLMLASPPPRRHAAVTPTLPLTTI